jgi:hypothetical protein
MLMHTSDLQYKSRVSLTDIPSLGRSALVCKSWNEVFQTDSFWQQKCILRYPSLQILPKNITWHSGKVFTEPPEQVPKIDEGVGMAIDGSKIYFSILNYFC